MKEKQSGDLIRNDLWIETLKAFFECFIIIGLFYQVI